MAKPVILQYASLPPDCWVALEAAWLPRLECRKRRRVERLRDPGDRAASLAGLALLGCALAEAGAPFAAAGVEHAPARKPHLRGAPDFSIAHAPGPGGACLAACVLGSGARIGLDLELRGAARGHQLRLVLDPDERAAVATGSLDATAAWVMKEAVLKAAGRTAAAAREVVLRGTTALHAGTLWHLAPVDLGAAHLGWVASDAEWGDARPVRVVRREAAELLALRA